MKKEFKVITKIKDSVIYAILRYHLFKVLFYLRLTDRYYVINPIWIKRAMSKDVIPLVDRIKSDELETDNPKGFAGDANDGQ